MPPRKPQSKAGPTVDRTTVPNARRRWPGCRTCRKQLAELQGENPLILPTVDYQAVAAVVGDWTGIPVGRMARNEIETILKVAEQPGRSA